MARRAKQKKAPPAYVFNRVVEDGCKDRVLTYSEFIQQAVNGKLTNPEDISSRRTDHPDWAGTPTWEDAVRLATHGYTGLNERIKETSSRISKVVCSRILRPEAKYAEAGDEVDVSRFLDGDPEHMIEYPTEEVRASGGRIVTLGCDLCFCCKVEPDQVKNRGAVICGVCDALESMGYRVEIRGFLSTESSTTANAPNWYRTLIIKESDQPLELERIGFVFCHPSFQRRMIFSFREQQPIEVIKAIGFSQSARHGLSVQHPGCDSCDIRFPVTNETEYKTVEQSIQQAIALLQASGTVELDLAA